MRELWRDACQVGMRLISSENTSLFCLSGSFTLTANNESVVLL
jgi:hypothetical protein